MNEYPNEVKGKLTQLITAMTKTLSQFVKAPGKDFSRERKLPFGKMMEIVISMGGNSVYKELLESQGYDVNTATTSAFIQQRSKILPFAFEHLLNEFTRTHQASKKYRGYRLLGVDGSDLHIPTNPDDIESYTQRKPDTRGWNQLHVNAMYDLRGRIYVDALVQPLKSLNEKRALTDMVERSGILEPSIIVADRNYESYNIFAHIERKGWKYAIRVKDIHSSGILSGLPLPSDDEFDVCVRRILTRKHTNEVKSNPEIYRYLSKKSTFDFLDKTTQFYTMEFRVVRIKITDDLYETIITNLDSAFTPDELKKLYAMRWGIETSFRELKYTIGLVNFHAKKREFIVQEIFARIIMYNFAEMITSHVIISQADTKHAYQINFSVAVSVCRRFLRLLNYEPPPDVEALIRKNILPVRPDRKAVRNIRQKSVVSFIYRIA
jgi:hypothetical protein